MVKESVFQSKVIKWLKEQGCYVIKNSANPGVPIGCPDVFFCKGTFYGFLEVKPNSKAPYQPLQEVTLDKLDAWNWARRVQPENWAEVQEELVLRLPK